MEPSREQRLHSTEFVQSLIELQLDVYVPQRKGVNVLIKYYAMLTYALWCLTAETYMFLASLTVTNKFIFAVSRAQG